MISHWACVSTPSATTFMPRPWAMETITFTSRRSLGLVVTSRTKDWSILTLSKGNRLRYCLTALSIIHQCTLGHFHTNKRRIDLRLGQGVCYLRNQIVVTQLKR